MLTNLNTFISENLTFSLIIKVIYITSNKKCNIKKYIHKYIIIVLFFGNFVKQLYILQLKQHKSETLTQKLHLYIQKSTNRSKVFTTSFPSGPFFTAKWSGVFICGPLLRFTSAPLSISGFRQDLRSLATAMRRGLLRSASWQLGSAPSTSSCLISSSLPSPFSPSSFTRSLSSGCR